MAKTAKTAGGSGGQQSHGPARMFFLYITTPPPSMHPCTNPCTAQLAGQLQPHFNPPNLAALELHYTAAYGFQIPTVFNLKVQSKQFQ